MPIVVEVLAQRTTISGLKTRKEDGGLGRRSQQGVDGSRTGCPWRKGFRRQLRGLSPGQRQGHPGSFPRSTETGCAGPKAAQINTVLKGKPGTAMAAFGGQLNDVEIAAVISYTRHAWSNAGKGQDPTVQPKDVTAGR